MPTPSIFLTLWSLSSAYDPHATDAPAPPAEEARGGGKGSGRGSSDSSSDKGSGGGKGSKAGRSGSGSKPKPSGSKPSGSGSKPSDSGGGSQPDASRPSGAPSANPSAARPSGSGSRPQAAAPGRSGAQAAPGQRGGHQGVARIPTAAGRASTSAQRGPHPTTGGTRPYTQGASDAVRAHYTPPPHRQVDHRYARPDHHHVQAHPHAHHPPPRWDHYTPYYSRWYVHPWYRAHYSTWVVVSFGFAVNPWVVTWAPPPRAGWVWVPGYWSGPYWVPGHWEPVAAAPVYLGVEYVYVPGWWQDDLYVEGYWRPESRADGAWDWVEGYYLEDGTYVSGRWEPAGAAPEGYQWEAGFFDGETWVEGFWRPQFRAGYAWVSSYYDEEGIFHTGYWEPLQAKPGHVWIPGWFDGAEWVDGYWISEQEYNSTDVGQWQPEEGWHDGWDPRTGEETAAPAPAKEQLPLAVPVQIEEEDL